MYIIKALVFGMAAAYVPRHVHKGDLRIFNGYNDTLSKYPYVVCLVGKLPRGYRFCTGFLITPVWGLTAAHCVVAQVKYIQYGNMTVPLSDSETKSEVLKMIKHPHFLKNTLKNDIALVKVNPVFLNKYGVLSAVDYTTLPGLQVKYAGYGYTFKLNRSAPVNKKRLKLHKRMPLQLGQAAVKRCEKNSIHLICIVPKCYQAHFTQYGDSGGPLFLEHKVIGVLSSAPIIYENMDRFFMPISPYLTWIRKMMIS